MQFYSHVVIKDEMKVAALDKMIAEQEGTDKVMPNSQLDPPEEGEAPQEEQEEEVPAHDVEVEPDNVD